MPNGKKIEVIRRIHGAGYLREFDTALHFNFPRLTIENNPGHSFAFDYRAGMGVILELQITSNRGVRIQDFGDLKVAEKWCTVEWWVNETSDVYKFCRGPEYPWEEVLNHRIGKHGTVKPGQPLEGVLLGRSATRIPSLYSHGDKLPLMLSIVDGFDTPHVAQLVVHVDDSLCSKIDRPSRGSLVRTSRGQQIRGSLCGPRSGNKSAGVDGVEHRV